MVTFQNVYSRDGNNLLYGVANASTIENLIGRCDNTYGVTEVSSTIGGSPIPYSCSTGTGTGETSNFYDVSPYVISKIYKDGIEYKINDVCSREGSKVTSPGIYWNREEGLISLSCNGSNWITICDKNLGATEVYTDCFYANPYIKPNNQFGYAYQWGRNIPFHRQSLNISECKSPDGYVSTRAPKFIATCGNWSCCNINNNWGACCSNVCCKQGPCPPGWHVPSRCDMTTLDTTLKCIGRCGVYARCKDDLRLLKFTVAPVIGYQGCSAYYDIDKSQPYWTGTKGGWGGYRNFWLSDYCNDDTGYMYTDDDDGEFDAPTNYSMHKSCGAAIRPFKNCGVQPNSSWEVLYQPSS